MDNQVLNDINTKIANLEYILTFHKHLGSDKTQQLTSSSGSGTVTSVALSGGTTGLGVTGSPITTSGTITLNGTLIAGNGGTGFSSYAVGDILYADTTTTLARLPIGTASQVLKVSGGLPAWQSNSSSIFSGQLISVTGADTCDLSVATSFFIYTPLLGSPSPLITVTNLYDGAQFRIFFRNSGTGNRNFQFTLTGLSNLIPSSTGAFTTNPTTVSTGNTIQVDCTFFSSLGNGITNSLFVVGTNYVF